jgi:hypothetical protein
MRTILLAAALTAAAIPAWAMSPVLMSPIVMSPAVREHLKHLGRMGLGTPVPEHQDKIQAKIQIAQAGEQQKASTKTASKAARPAKSSRKGTLNPRVLAERAGYKRLSSLVNFPAFFPGIGIVFVKPGTLPLGPYLSFDRKDRLISTIFMVPLDQMNDHKKFDADAGLAGARINHVTMYFNGGHPGVDMPHYHYVLWHVSRKDEALVAR